MSILKREVLVSKPVAHKGIFIGVVVGTVLAPALLVIGVMIGYANGLYMGAQAATYGGGNPSLVEETTDACGITDPLACVTSILESVADLFHPEMPAIMTVTYTATTVTAPNCGLIMDTFHKLPRARLIEMPALLEQVEDCKALYRSSGID